MSDQSDYDDVVVKGPEIEEHPSQEDIVLWLTTVPS